MEGGILAREIDDIAKRKKYKQNQYGDRKSRKDDYTGEHARQWLNFTYSFIPAGMDRFNGQPMEVLTDDAIPTDRANANWSVINSGYSTTNMFPLEYRKADTYGESWT